MVLIRRENCESWVRESDYLKVVEEKQEQSNLRSLAEEKMEELASYYCTELEVHKTIIEKKEKELEELKTKNNEYLYLYNLDKNKIENLEKELEELKLDLKEADENQVFLTKEIGEKNGEYLKMLNERNHYLYEVVKLKNDDSKMLKEKDEGIGRYKNLVTLNEEKLLKELKEKEENINILVKYNHEIIENNNELRECITETGAQSDILLEELEKAKDINVELVFENKELKEHIDVLTELLKEKEEKPKEKLWQLEYIYSTDKVNCKVITLDPQPKEELEELIGMDSDNWIQYKMWEV